MKGKADINLFWKSCMSKLHWWRWYRYPDEYKKICVTQNSKKALFSSSK